MMPARTTGMRSAPATSTAAGDGVAGASVALAKGGKAAETAGGVDAPAIGAGDLVVGLAHPTSFLELFFAICAAILINWHVGSSYD